MAKEIDGEPEKRDTSIPIWGDDYAWWTKLTRARIRERGTNQKLIAKKLGFSESEVSRAITRVKPLFEVLIALADELDIPYPVILPKSLREATELAKHRRLILSDDELARIKADAAQTKKRRAG